MLLDLNIPTSLVLVDTEKLLSHTLLDLQILSSLTLLNPRILTSLTLLNRKILTSLTLLDLEGEVQGSDGEVDGLGVHPAHLTQQVHDEAPLTPHQTGQQLRDPETAVSCIHFPSILSHKVYIYFNLSYIYLLQSMERIPYLNLQFIN